MTDTILIRNAIRREDLDGWLFCNFAHRDRLTDRILGIEDQRVSSRRWFYLIPENGEPLKIVHAIEMDALSTLPGSTKSYVSRKELVALLSHYRGKRFAILSDPNLQVLSTMDASSRDIIEESGIQWLSAASLVQRVEGLLSPSDILSHERSAAHLYRIVHEAWEYVRSTFGEGNMIREGDIQAFMLRRLDRYGLVTDHPPIVAAGRSSGNPHYAPTEGGSLLAPGDIVQFDIWAKESGGIYSDIAWCGCCADSPTADQERTFALLCQARDLVLPHIEKALNLGQSVSGASLDILVRSYLLERFPREVLKHRTGHGIDRECHGFGVNLDSLEFPDNRSILEGSCFSVEPGLYFESCGYRTEIDIYIHNGLPVISGGPIQRRLLTLRGDEHD